MKLSCLHNQDPRGVTLLELIAVLLIMGLIAAVSVIGFGGSVVNAKRRQSVERFLLIDQGCRTLADRSGQLVTLKYDISKSQLLRKVDPDGDWFLLATNVELHKAFVVSITGGALGDDASREGLGHGVTPSRASPIQIQFFSDGSSDTYVLAAHEMSCQLVVGATGQSVALPNTSEVRELVNGI